MGLQRKEKVKCPLCEARLRKVAVRIEGATQKVMSYQCTKCKFFEFEKSTATKAIAELTPLKIRQKVVKLSADRLGIYFNSNIVRSLDIKKGEEIYVSVPDKHHIVLERPNKL